MSQRRRGSLPAWLHTPLYLGVRMACAAMLTRGVGPNLHTAAEFGRRFAHARANRKRLARAVDNLAVAFPHWSYDQREHYAIRAYQHLFMLMVETAYAPRLLTQGAWSDHLRLGDLGPSVRHLLAGAGEERRPCILITGHCGNWELLGYTMALLGFPVHALYRPLDLAPLDRWVRATRERQGLILIDKFGATRILPRVLAQGGAAGFVADQNAGDRGLFVPFFGRLASAYKTIGLVAMRHRAPIICGVARRLVWERDAATEAFPPPGPDAEGEGEGNGGGGGGGVGFQHWRGEGFRYRIDVTDVIHPEEWDDFPDPLFYITARYRRAIEAGVRRAPEQYLWMHRYWKSRPRHEHLGRPIPASLRDKLRALPWMTDEEMARIEDWTRRDTAALAASKPR